MGAGTFDLRNKKLVVNGFLITGLEAEIEADYYEDGWFLGVGLDGNVVRSRNNNESGHIDFSLQQGNSLNAVLTGFYLADRAGAGALVTVALVDADSSALAPEAIGGTQGWIKKMPKVGYAAKSTGYKWVIDVAKLNMVLGGSATY